MNHLGKFPTDYEKLILYFRGCIEVPKLQYRDRWKGSSIEYRDKEEIQGLYDLRDSQGTCTRIGDPVRMRTNLVRRKGVSRNGPSEKHYPFYNDRRHFLFRFLESLNGVTLT